jgi:hypothetical protein
MGQRLLGRWREQKARHRVLPAHPSPYTALVLLTELLPSLAGLRVSSVLPPVGRALPWALSVAGLPQGLTRVLNTQGVGLEELNFKS